MIPQARKPNTENIEDYKEHCAPYNNTVVNASLNHAIEDKGALSAITTILLRRQQPAMREQVVTRSRGGQREDGVTLRRLA
jgi:hypothetical protein